jgi:hypothetical protein
VLLKFAAQHASAFAAVNHLQSEALTVSAGARPENPKITHENANTGMSLRIEFLQNLALSASMTQRRVK